MSWPYLPPGFADEHDSAWVWLPNSLYDPRRGHDLYRAGNLHTYTYDVLGRQTSDSVTTLGGGVDGAVRRIDTAYDGQGNAYLLTSYGTTGGGTVVNQGERPDHRLGQLTAQYHAHKGARTPLADPDGHT